MYGTLSGQLLNEVISCTQWNRWTGCEPFFPERISVVDTWSSNVTKRSIQVKLPDLTSRYQFCWVANLPVRNRFKRLSCVSQVFFHGLFSNHGFDSLRSIIVYVFLLVWAKYREDSKIFRAFWPFYEESFVFLLLFLLLHHSLFFLIHSTWVLIRVKPSGSPSWHTPQSLLGKILIPISLFSNTSGAPAS